MGSAENKKINDYRWYFRWPFIIGLLFLIPAIIGSVFVPEYWYFFIGAVLIFFFVAGILSFIVRKNAKQQILNFAAAFAALQREGYEKSIIPSALCDENGKIYWKNDAFEKVFPVEKTDAHIPALFPSHTWDFTKNDRFPVTTEKAYYQVLTQTLDEEAKSELQGLIGEEVGSLSILSFFDETDLMDCRKQLAEEQPVVAFIYVDNYEEAMPVTDEVRRSFLSALLEQKIVAYISGDNGIVRKLEKDRYLAVFNQKALWKMQEEKFAILENVKTLTGENELPLSLSIGIGTGSSSYVENIEFARAAIDMALSRGGDQAVLKDRENIQFYGGKLKTSERTTRVKARIKANALKSLISEKKSVIVMGHPLSDHDCFGAAVGISRIAKFSGKEVHILFGNVPNSVIPLMTAFRESKDYTEDLFISAEEAKNILSEDTLLVVVDTNRPSYTVCPELLTMGAEIVVIDHHRQGKETIENAVLSYVESYASSASEMVAELVQYYDDRIKLKPIEADAVLSGIVMDTNSFEDKSGVRTFEAAAYLRRCGADVTRVRKIFRDSMEDYKLRAETIRKAQVFHEDYIISVCPNETKNPNQTVVAAQAANELLEIRGIKASFVITEYEDTVYLSARSIDEVNVQVMMEKLGGGGHMSVAGAQFTDTTTEEVIEKLKKIILEQEEK